MSEDGWNAGSSCLEMTSQFGNLSATQKSVFGNNSRFQTTSSFSPNNNNTNKTSEFHSFIPSQPIPSQPAKNTQTTTFGGLKSGFQSSGFSVQDASPSANQSSFATTTPSTNQTVLGVVKNVFDTSLSRFSSDSPNTNGTDNNISTQKSRFSRPTVGFSSNNTGQDSGVGPALKSGFGGQPTSEGSGPGKSFTYGGFESEGASGGFGSGGTNGTFDTGKTSGAFKCERTAGVFGSGTTSGGFGCGGPTGESKSAGGSFTSGGFESEGANKDFGSGGTSGAFGSGGSSGAFGAGGSGGAFGIEKSSGAFGSVGTNGALGTGGSSGAFGIEKSSGAFGSVGTNGVFGIEKRSGAFGSGGSSGAFGTEKSGGAFGSGASSGAFGTEKSSEGFGSGGTSRAFGAGGSSGGFGSGGSSGGFGSGGSSGGFGSGGSSGGFGTGGSSGGFGSGGSSGAFGSGGSSGGFGSGGTSGVFETEKNSGGFGSGGSSGGFGSGGGFDSNVGVNKEGHWKSFSKTGDRSTTKCYNCKQEGHKTAECTEPSRGCFNCNDPDHKSAECPLPKKDRGPVKCFNCGVDGHHSTECPEPKKSFEDGLKLPSTFIPEDEKEEELFKSTIEQGKMFDRFFEAETSVTCGSAAQPQPIQSFETFNELNFMDQVKRNLHLCRYSRPTPVQKLSMPIIINGQDLVACAQTGSGKTAAYLLPIISKLLKSDDFNHPGENGCFPRVLVIVPTRELAVQVYNETRKYAYGTVISCKAVYGGTAVGYQKAELLKGATIIAATLGRLKHFVSDGTIKLDHLHYFVLDEVDRLLEQDNGDDIKSVHDQIPNKESVQGIMFSATFPVTVQDQARLLLKKDYAMVTVDTIGAANKCITQNFEMLEQSAKKDKLLEILEINKDNYTISPDSKIFEKKILIFVSKKGFADTLASIISHSGIPSTTIHADRQQNERSEAMKDFTYGRKAIMIATAVMERGLDIKGVDLVVNFDMPEDLDQYVHRIGRTGRVGNAGQAISFFVPGKDTKLASGLVKCLQQAGQLVPEWLKQEAQVASSYDVFTNGFGSSQPIEEEFW